MLTVEQTHKESFQCQHISPVPYIQKNKTKQKNQQNKTYSAISIRGFTIFILLSIVCICTSG